MGNPTRSSTSSGPTLLGILAWVALPLSLPAPAAAQGTERLPLRVSSATGGGRVVVDRGSRDRVQNGDPVVLRPRGQPELRGVVTEVRDRSAVVDLHDKSARPNPGTSGEVLVPAGRGKTPPDPARPRAGQPEKPDRARPDPGRTDPGKADPGKPEPGKDPGKPEFRNKDEDWRPGQPLLQGRPVRPEQRPTRVTGRIYSMGRYADTARDTDTDSFIRLGTDLDVENPFGYGGELKFNAEYDVRTERGENDANHDLLLRGLSYRRGGTRFDPDRWEFGRFLQRGMPEFQVIDGVEWGTRRPNGDRFGASLGFMPEPDEDYESFEDLQIAAYYDWVLGEHEELTISAGLQKTWHNGDTDRDLLVAKVRYLPQKGWQFHSSVWIDYYDSSELVQDSGLEMTQAFATLRRNYDDGDSLDLTYRRVRFPDIRRHEFYRPLAVHLADNRYDRLAVTDRTSMTKSTRLLSQAGVWEDEEDSGGNAELGTETRDMFASKDRLDLGLYGQLGQATTSGGARVHYGVAVTSGRWDLYYEYGFHHHKGMQSDRNNLAQARFRVSRSFFTDDGYEFTFGADAVNYDSELSWALDFNLQKTF